MKNILILAGVLAIAVLLCIPCPLNAATIYKFDMNNSGGDSDPSGLNPSPTQSGFIGVNRQVLYGNHGGLSYGWLDNFGSGTTWYDRDRGAIAGNPRSDLLRDVVIGGLGRDNTFSVGLSNGTYEVTLYFRDDRIHSDFDVAAEGITKISHLNYSNPLSEVVRTFEVQVIDGKLDLSFHTNSDTRWFVSGIEVASVPEPSIILLLGFGLTGLAGLRVRQRT